MEIKPRPYQKEGIDNVEKSWNNGSVNTMLVSPTGSGKTLVKAFMAERFVKKGKLVVVFAHRDVLLSQISDALAMVGLEHQFVCSKATEKEIGNIHVKKYGRSFINPRAKVIVASVLTWIRRDTSAIAEHAALWMLDEAHHLSIDSIWEKAVKPLVHAVGMGVTATPVRGDKKGLGRGHGGIFDELVETKTMGELIEIGALSPYRIYTTGNIDVSNVNKTGSGDYNQKKLAKETDKADITGDAVEHYLRIAPGEQCITFCVNIEHATHVAAQFNREGVKSHVLSSKTPLKERQEKEAEFRAGIVTNLVNVDLFGEGYDVPKCSVVIMLRKTASYSLFKQQFGRMLRPADGKEFGVLIDHVGNVHEHCIHGSPHDDPEWSLEAPKKKKKTDAGKGIILRTCPECFGNYTPKANVPSAFVCPYCKHSETDEERNAAQREIQVREGTLIEYDCSYVNGLINQRKEVDSDVAHLRYKMFGAPPVVVNSATKNHLKRQEAQRQLRQWIQSWCAELGAKRGLDVETVQNEFTRVFGMDVFKAQVLSERLSLELLDKIKANWSDLFSVDSVNG